MLSSGHGMAVAHKGSQELVTCTNPVKKANLVKNSNMDGGDTLDPG